MGKCQSCRAETLLIPDAIYVDDDLEYLGLSADDYLCENCNQKYNLVLMENNERYDYYENSEIKED